MDVRVKIHDDRQQPPEGLLRVPYLRIMPDEPLDQGPSVTVHCDQCKACGLCINSCPKGVLQKGSVINVLGYEATEYCGDGCVGCGNCFYVCPEPGAISVVKRPHVIRKPDEVPEIEPPAKKVA